MVRQISGYLFHALSRFMGMPLKFRATLPDLWVHIGLICFLQIHLLSIEISCTNEENYMKRVFTQGIFSTRIMFVQVYHIKH